MDIITSLANETVKETCKLQQKKYRTSLFLLEGIKVLEEAINSNLEIERIFINQKREDYVKQFNKFNIILTNDVVLKKISTTDSAPDIVAVAKQKVYGIDFLKNKERVLLLENIKDAGNLGTIIRSAKAFDFDAIVLYGNTVDLYNPKTIRSAVGNLWKLPIISIKDISLLKSVFKNYDRVATLPISDNKLSSFTPKFPVLLMFGSEADGLSEELKCFATTNLTIEMNESVESLNLAISAGICMYQISSKKMMF